MRGEEVRASFALDARGFLGFFGGGMAGEERRSRAGSEGDSSELMSILTSFTG